MPTVVASVDTSRLRAAFDAFLRAEDYTILTANKSAVALHGLVELALAGEPLPAGFRLHGIRALRWLRLLRGRREEIAFSLQATRLYEWLERSLEGETIDEPRPKKFRASKLDKFSTEQWKKLTEYAEEHADESPEDLVLLSAMRLPLRIGKVLDTPLSTLREMTRNEMLRARFGVLLKTYKTLGEMLSSSKRKNASYLHMKRHLYEVGDVLGFDFDFHAISRSRQDYPRE
jgi:hypothetical protein